MMTVRSVKLLVRFITSNSEWNAADIAHYCGVSDLVNARNLAVVCAQEENLKKLFRILVDGIEQTIFQGE
jgi:hypothetical protein